MPINRVLLPVLAALLWLPGFWISPTTVYEVGTMPFFSWLHQLTASFPWLESTLGFALVAGQAFLLNILVNMYQLLPKRTALPALLYVLIMSSVPGLLHLYPALLALLFVLLALFRMFAMVRSENGQSPAFDAAFLLSIGSLFYFPTIVLLPMVWVALNDFRPFQWRDWAMPVLGFALPYVFVATWFFWNDELAQAVTAHLVFPGANTLWLFPQTYSFYAVVGSLILATLLSIAAYTRTINSNVVNIRKTLIEFILILLLSVGGFFLAPVRSVDSLAFLAVPVAVMVANWLLTMNRVWLAELLFAAWLGCIIWNHLSAA